jgi:predicted metalloendopeptidase
MSSLLKDFYSHTNKGWLQKQTIRADKNSVSVFDTLEESIKNDMKKLLHYAKGTSTPFGTFVASAYNGWHDDLKYLDVFLENHTSFTDSAECAHMIGRINLYGLRTPIEIEIAHDVRNTHAYAIFIGEPELGIPKSEFIEKGEIYHRYKKFLRDVSVASKIPNLSTEFFSIEEDLAKFYIDREDMGKAEYIYNPMTFSMLCKEFPNIHWNSLFTGMQISSDALPVLTFVVTNPMYLRQIDKYMLKFTISKWQFWVKSSICLSLMGVLHAPYDKLNFDFYMKFLKGQQKQDDTDTRVYDICNEVCSEALGKLYVETNYETCEKIRIGGTQIKDMVVAAAKERVMKLNWLSEGSKKIAQHKLTTMGHKIAFPNIWFDEFKGVPIDKNSFLLNLLGLNKRSVLWSISKLAGETPAMRKLWSNPCFDVNAYYYSELNELCIPLGFLKKPFFSLDADFIENLAGVGNIIGHEISHGFDEEGRKYDEHGNYFPWWTSVDVELYNRKTRFIIDEFDKESYKGLKINGELTLGENLADLGAIAICIDVLKARWRKQNTPKSEQLAELRKYFIAYSKSWAYKEKKAAREMAVKNDPHAPAQLRVNIILRHCNEFYEAFGFTEKDEGWIPPSERIDVWGK